MNKTTLTLKEGINILTDEELLEHARRAHNADEGIAAFMLKVAVVVNRNPRTLEWYPWLRELSSDNWRQPAYYYAVNCHRYQKLNRPENVWVACYVKNGEVVGFCRLSNPTAKHIGTLDHLCVPFNEHRSLGHATALITGLGDFAREQGMSLLEAYSTTNMEESFYDTLGKRGFDSDDEPCHRIKLA